MCVCVTVTSSSGRPSAVRIWLLSRRGLAEQLCAPPLYHHSLACVRYSERACARCANPLAVLLLLVTWGEG